MDGNHGQVQPVANSDVSKDTVQTVAASTDAQPVAARDVSLQHGESTFSATYDSSGATAVMSGRLAVDIASRDSPQGDAPPDRLSRREGATQHTRTSPAVGMTWRSGASSSFADMQPRGPIRVVDISNLVTQAVQQFKLLAVAGLDQMSAQDRVEVGPEATLVAWADVPRACSFQIARLGGRGHQRHISAEGKVEQQRVYTAHQLWAATCGVDALAW